MASEGKAGEAGERDARKSVRKTGAQGVVGQGAFLARENLTADREYEITLVKARK